MKSTAAAHGRKVAGRSIPTVRLPAGEEIPVVGQGTWHMAEDPGRHEDELAALRLGLDMGLSLIDTAEMYADGAAEELVGEAIAGRRDEVFLVSKVLPQHASRRGTLVACEASLRRLGTDRIDLYLLHWRGRFPLDQTLDAFGVLVDQGKIRFWGVSNFDVADMADLFRVEAGGSVQTDQVLYSLAHRTVERELLPASLELGVPIMAYSPIEQGRLVGHPVLESIAARHDATSAQVALAWVLHQDGVAAIPKAGSPAHVRENAGALEIRLTDEDLAALDRAFPPPRRKVPLAMY
jgi:diketogulonate reductase-like aldo/keto reductase